MWDLSYYDFENETPTHRSRKVAKPLKSGIENRVIGWLFIAVDVENLMHLDPALCTARQSPAALDLGLTFLPRTNPCQKAFWCC